MVFDKAVPNVFDNFNQAILIRMGLIKRVSSIILVFIKVILKTMGLGESNQGVKKKKSNTNATTTSVTDYIVWVSNTAGRLKM